MSRDLHADFETEILKPSWRPVLFYEGEFPGGVLRLWSGRGIYAWNGFDWAGGGGMLAISDITESADLRSTGMRIDLSGVNNPQIIALARSQAKLGCPARFWFGAVKDDQTIVLNPALMFEGRLDVPTISLDDKTCVISIVYVSELIELKRPRVLYMTHEQQQLRKQGDMFFQYTAGLLTQVITW